MEFNFTGKTILIVEDEEVSRYFFEKALKKSKANLLFVNDGIDAIAIMKSNPEIDLILMDIRLPRMDGIEATTQIKALFPEIPIIIQTAYAMQSVQDEATKADVMDLSTSL